MAGRRSDTRERIQDVALELFAEQGYDKTSLREIAERLDVTKAALYYHFRTKEDIVRSLVEELAASVDELVEWARAQPDSVAARPELLRRFNDLVEGQFSRVMQFAQQNQTAMKDVDVKHTLLGRMTDLYRFLVDDPSEPESHLRARLALMALIFVRNPHLRADLGVDISPDVALRVANDLIAPKDG